MSTRDHPDWWRPVGGSNAQDSILERRSLVWNDDGIVDGTVPDDFYTCETYKGKFFPRGCRGMIEEIQIYCRDTVVDHLDLRYSPHPCLGPFGMIAVTPTAVWGWRGAVVEEMWNYDSLFIWVHSCTEDVSWAYDTVLPYDGHLSTDAGATWADMAIRPFIRVVYTGETPGDVPVSGIVNTIEIPNVAAELGIAYGVNVPDSVYTEICRSEGAGTLLKATIDFHTGVVPAAGILYQLLLWTDGAYGFFEDNRSLTQSNVATSGRNMRGEFIQFIHDEDDITRLNLSIPVKWRREIRLAAWQTTGGAVEADGWIFGNELV